MNIARYLLTTLPMVLLIPVAARAQNPEGFDRNKVLAEWHSLSEKVTSRRNEFILESYRLDEAGSPKLYRKDIVKDSFNANGKSFFFEIEYFGKNEAPYNMLEILNEKYSASLKRIKEKDAWVLRRTTPWSKDADKTFPPLPWLVCGNIRLLIWIADDSFVISRTERLQSGIVRVHFVTDQSKRKSKDAPEFIKSGFIDFDPDHSNCPVAYEYHYRTNESSGSESGTMEYEFIGINPILKAVLNEETNQHDKYGLTKSRKKRSCNTEYNAHVPDEEFRLSFYGLPEPVGVEWPKPPRLWLWLTLAAAGSLILAAVYWKLKGRFQKPEAANASQ